MSTDDELFTRSEVRGGFSAKRARLLLFQIENRTAYLMMQGRRAVDRYLTEETAEQQDLAFFESLVEGREPTIRPTMRDLERYAPHWQSLVPRNLTLQAALAHLLGQKYHFAQRDIPHIRQALGLDTEGVQQAFQRQYRQSLDTIYTRRVGLLEWMGWRWNKLSGWLEHLPPFWTAYALTFTEIVGASILALPIALAGVGPLAGVVFLLVMGVINVLTIASMAEAVTRSGSIRYQGSYLGRLVQDHLCHSSPGLLSRVLAHPGWRHADTRRSLGRTAFPAWHLFCSSKKFACHHQQRPGGRCYQPGFDPDPLGTCFRTCPSGELAVCACPVPQWTPFRTGPAGLNLRRGVCLLFWPLLGEQLCQNRSAA